MGAFKNMVIDDYDKACDCIKQAYNGDVKAYFKDWCLEVAEQKRQLQANKETLQLVWQMVKEMGI